MKSKIYFITKGKQKFEEIQDLIPEDLKIEVLDLDYPEIQSMDIEEVAKFGAKFVADKINKTVIVDDMGLFIESLNNLPGTFTKYFAKHLKPEGVLRLMKGIDNRNASFKVCLGFCKPKEEPLAFVSERVGKIVLEVKTGPYDFGLNSIFIPLDSDKTLAQFTFKEKIKNEPRRKAFEKLLNHVRTK